MFFLFRKKYEKKDFTYKNLPKKQENLTKKTTKKFD